jgi:hypothetical protein
MADQIQSYLREQMPVWKTRHTGVEAMTVAVMGCVVNGPRRIEARQSRHLATRNIRRTGHPGLCRRQAGQDPARRRHRGRVYRNGRSIRSHALRLRYIWQDIIAQQRRCWCRQDLARTRVPPPRLSPNCFANYLCLISGGLYRDLGQTWRHPVPVSSD